MVPGATYTLTVASGHRSRAGNVYAGLRLQITADGKPVATLDNAQPPAQGSFGDVTLRWTAPAALEGAALGVRVSALTPGGTSYVDIDNVRLSAIGPTYGVANLVSRQVVQRQGSLTAVPVRGTAPGADQVSARLVVRAGYPGATTAWTPLSVGAGGSYTGAIPGVPGGWYDLEVRALSGGVTLSNTTVPRIGVGEVFITAGQSNSANWGSPPQVPRRRSRVGDDVEPCRLAIRRRSAAHRRRRRWLGLAGVRHPVRGPDRPAGGGAGGRRGRVVRQPVAARRRGSTQRLQAAIKAVGPRGFRAILWHQGEADASQCMATATYASQLTNVINASRRDAGWTVPWGVATASELPWNSSGCEQAINAAQAQVVTGTPSVFAGPDTNGYSAAGLAWDNIHFNTPGLTLHGNSWVESITRWGGVPAR